MSNNYDDNRKPPPMEDQPNFRFASLQAPETATLSVAAADPRKQEAVIDKMDYFVPAPVGQPPAIQWAPTRIPSVPAFYPLEKSSRLIQNISGTEIAGRMCQILKTLSVQAIYDNEAATAQLLTGEHVEMHLSLWSNNAEPGVLVEVQRRKGDPILFYNYSRQILDAATGHVVGSAQHSHYSKKVQRLFMGDTDEPANAIVAMEIAHGLVRKDRMDARVLGLESLCLLTDPEKTGEVTAVLASHAVLLGSLSTIEIPGVNLHDSLIYQEIREAILGLVQFSRIGDEEGQDDAEHLMLLHNLALAVLANALNVIEKDSEEDLKPRGRLRTASSNDVTNEFLKTTEETSNKEILSTLIRELGQAGTKPHDACLSAKCLGTICRASDEARKRAKELGAKTVVATALDVGQQTHSKLETECEEVQKVLRLSE